MVHQLTKKYIYPFIGIVVYVLAIYLLGSDTRCLIRNTLGIPCPGCGMTRAYSNLFSGNIVGAFQSHPLFILPIIIGIVIVLRNTKLVNGIYRSNRFWIVLLILIIGVYAIRMILYFPNTEPMEFNPNGLIPRLINYIF